MYQNEAAYLRKRVITVGAVELSPAPFFFPRNRVVTYAALFTFRHLEKKLLRLFCVDIYNIDA